ncbi:hypothetical protein NE398_16930 [Clostridium tertium]|uniref:Uncharacterized protein n=1 Tax=Clostridium tertium TaxID=1559 RepID=A0A9X4B2J6_9CLOT|nr:hypothetical protein [Clostridium tertium]MDC4241822.1 hypothetical protein [Clostridium tertium]
MANEMNIVVDSGIIYYGDFDTSTLDNLMTTINGKELGLIKSSLKFEAKPEIRDIEYAGSLERKIKGMQRILKWDVSAEADILDFNENVLTASLIKKESNESTKFDVYSPSNNILDGDYKDLLIVGKKHKSNEPIVIHIFNSYNPEGMSFEMKDKDEASTSMKFIGAYTFEDDTKKPFKIYMPKKAV